MDEVAKYTKYEWFIFVFVTMMISGASSIANNDFIRIIVMGFLLIYNHQNRKKLFNNTLFYLLCGWLFINLVSSLYFNKTINFYPFIGKVTLIYIAYSVIIGCEENFWGKYENFLYKLVIISFILYLLSLLGPSIFDGLTNIFRPFTDEFFYQKESQKHYFYSFFFVYRGGEALLRNNGFMWEPGAYAMLLNILIAYNFARHGIQMNKHIKVYTIALLTTFSTVGYLTFFLLVLLFFLRVQNIYLKILIFAGGVLTIGWLTNIDFLLPKIEKFLASAEKMEVYHQSYRNLYEANRILSFKLLCDKFLMFPLGWGCIDDTTSYMALRRIVTVNGLGNLLVTWGAFGFIFFIYSIYKFFKQYSQSTFISLFALLVIAALFFSNPIENNLLLFLLVLSPYITKENEAIQL